MSNHMGKGNPLLIFFYFNLSNRRTMKKKTTTSKLTIDKETVANLNFEQLSESQTVQIQGGLTPFTGMPISCCGVQYTSCV